MSHLAYLSGSQIPSRAANSVHVMKMCSALTRLGHRVSLWAVGEGEAHGDDYRGYGVDADFQIHRVPRSNIKRFGSILHGERIAREALDRNSEIDLVYSRHVYAAWAAARRGAPLVYEAHSPPRNVMERYCERRIIASPGFRRLVVISDALRRDYIRLFRDLPPERVIVAHDAADPVGASHAATAVSLKTGGNRYRLNVGYTGNFYPGRGLDVILSVAELLPDVGFHFVGGSREECRKVVGTEPPTNAYFYGHVEHALVSEYLRKFDGVLAPYQDDVRTGGGYNIVRWMSPMKLFEYMASGVAIVASNLSVLREILQDGSNSLLVAPSDVAAWKEAILRLQDDELRARLGRGARQAHAACYTWDRRAAAVLEGVVLRDVDSRLARVSTHSGPEA